MARATSSIARAIIFWVMARASLVFGLGFLFGVAIGFSVAKAEPMRTSFYGAESGTKTANGETFRPFGLTAAHRTLPFGTRLRVTYGGHSVVVRINDRGPAKWTGRDLDLSHGAAIVLGMVRAGVVNVQAERLP